MIDWWAVATTGLWILGMSILLAAFSYHDWLARETGRRRRDLFNEFSFRLPCTCGIFLACVGWGLGQAGRWWERAFFFLIAASFGLEMRGLIASVHKRSKTQSGGRI